MKHRGSIAKLVITFDKAADPAFAGNTTNYSVSVAGHRGHKEGRHRTATVSRRVIGVVSAAYNAAEHQVTLTLDTRLHRSQAIELQIEGTSGTLTVG